MLPHVEASIFLLSIAIPNEVNALCRTAMENTKSKLEDWWNQACHTSTAASTIDSTSLGYEE